MKSLRRIEVPATETPELPVELLMQIYLLTYGFEKVENFLDEKIDRQVDARYQLLWYNKMEPFQESIEWPLVVLSHVSHTWRGAVRDLMRNVYREAERRSVSHCFNNMNPWIQDQIADLVKSFRIVHGNQQTDQSLATLINCTELVFVDENDTIRSLSTMSKLSCLRLLRDNALLTRDSLNYCTGLTELDITINISSGLSFNGGPPKQILKNLRNALSRMSLLRRLSLRDIYGQPVPKGHVPRFQLPPLTHLTLRNIRWFPVRAFHQLGPSLLSLKLIDTGKSIKGRHMTSLTSLRVLDIESKVVYFLYLEDMAPSVTTLKCLTIRGDNHVLYSDSLTPLTSLTYLDCTTAIILGNMEKSTHLRYLDYSVDLTNTRKFPTHVEDRDEFIKSCIIQQ